MFAPSAQARNADHSSSHPVPVAPAHRQFVLHSAFGALFGQAATSTLSQYVAQGVTMAGFGFAFTAHPMALR